MIEHYGDPTATLADVSAMKFISKQIQKLQLKTEIEHAGVFSAFVFVVYKLCSSYFMLFFGRKSSVYISLEIE